VRLPDHDGIDRMRIGRGERQLFDEPPSIHERTD
jgi:hypothetical protein